MTDHSAPTRGEVFWSMVDKAPGHGPNGDCWLWTGVVNSEGYGMLSTCRATHISLELAGRKNSGKLHALHSCDNRLCVNPAHLRWGSNHENVQDMIVRRRHHNNRKTACVRGHELSGDNLISRANGQRGCRKCQRRHDAAYKAKRLRNLGRGV